MDQIDGEVLEASLQTILNVLREADIRTALAKGQPEKPEHEGNSTSLREDALSSSQIHSTDPSEKVTTKPTTPKTRQLCPSARLALQMLMQILVT